MGEIVAVKGCQLPQINKSFFLEDNIQSLGLKIQRSKSVKDLANQPDNNMIADKVKLFNTM